MATEQLRPITIRGVTYPTVSSAAKAFAVSKDTIRAARCRGRLDFVGLGSCSSRGTGTRFKPIPITLFGVSFPSRRAANLALGHGTSYIQNILRRKTPTGLARLEADVQRWLAENH